MIAKTLRKNTTWPSGIVSPTKRTKADITANSSTDTSLIEMARCTFMRQHAVWRGREDAAYARAAHRSCMRWAGAECRLPQLMHDTSGWHNSKCIETSFGGAS